jgi:FHS family L-fucose permease-like MFS transporter
MDDNMASIVLTCALGFFMVGRFGGSFIMRYIRPEVMLLICGCGCVLSTLVVLMNFGEYSMIGLLAIYLFEAVMFPTIFSLALRGLGSLTKTASSILMMTPVGGCGFLLVGVIADATNLVIPFVIPMLCYIIVGLYGFGLVVPGTSQKA